eukprot:7432274-Pyramimonas_sp.AAC.1
MLDPRRTRQAPGAHSMGLNLSSAQASGAPQRTRRAERLHSIAPEPPELADHMPVVPRRLQHCG